MAKVKPIKCKCGKTWGPLDVPTNKEWNMISPMPCKDGNVTITRMATWTCPACGKTKTGAKGKTKGEFKEEDTSKYKMEQAIKSREKFCISELAEEIGYSVESILKIIPLYQKKFNIKGKIDGDYFVPG
ncbi:hypothetical protein EU534_01215 [Candidatus Heimdallarchaeota archaeon]|nr:MAG: hypothetical protein EU534_01215 [Candidatus Heimdallarchaeota archaeon]